MAASNKRVFCRASNILAEPSVERGSFCSPLKIKLRLIKQSVKALDKNGDCFKYIYTVFPNLTSEKLRAGIFDELQVRKFLKDTSFVKTLSEKEASTW